MEDIMAELGFGVTGPGTEERMRGIATNLRGDRSLGQFFQASGNQSVRDAGRNLVTDAQTSTDNIADARQKGLTRTRQKAMDEQERKRYATEQGQKKSALEITAEKYKTEQAQKDAALQLDADILEYERGGWTDIEERKDSEGNVALYGLKDGRGELQKIPKSDGLTEVDPYAGRGGAGSQGWRSGTLASGSKIDHNVITGEIMVKGEKFPNIDAFRKAYPDEQLSDETKAARAMKLAESDATLQATNIDEAFTTARKTRKSIGGWRKLLDIARKADPGQSKWEQYLPTLKSATALFESQEMKMALENLPPELRPFSDTDLAGVLEAQIPNLPRDELILFIENKMEGIERAANVLDETTDYYKELGTTQLNREQRAELERRVDAEWGDYTPSNAAKATLGGDVDLTEEEQDADAARLLELESELKALNAAEAPAPAASPLAKTLQGLRGRYSGN
jgi:hypothetical protein